MGSIPLRLSERQLVERTLLLVRWEKDARVVVSAMDAPAAAAAADGRVPSTIQNSRQAADDGHAFPSLEDVRRLVHQGSDLPLSEEQRLMLDALSEQLEPADAWATAAEVCHRRRYNGGSSGGRTAVERR